MPLTRRLIAVVAFLAIGTNAVFAEANSDVPPNCPGGNLKGKFTCTGPIGAQTCTEGPPWVCELTKDKDPPAAALGDGGVRPPRFPVFETLAGGNSGAVFEPATGGGGGSGGGKGPMGGNVGTMPVLVSTGGGGPTIL